MKNTYIPLSHDSKIRADAAGTIKYTLLLNYELPSVNSNSNLIEDLFTKCHNCCSGLFSNTPEQITYNFFGSKHINLNQPHTSFPQLHNMILNHCIISSYHAIITELLEGEYVSSYALVNKIRTKGIDELYKNNFVINKGNKLSFKNRNDSSYSQKSRKASDFYKKSDSHKDILEPLFISMPSDNTYQYSLQFSSLCYKICNIYASKFKKFDFKSSNIFLNWLTEMHSSFISETDIKAIATKNKANIFPIDFLYTHFLSERLFNFRLIYSLLRNILIIEEKTDYRICTNEILKILSLCKKLPNVFSRQYFLKFAFDSFDDISDSYADFWHENDMKGNDIIMGINRTQRLGFQFEKWIEQYELFINYMSEFVIPIYEWCFLDMLLSVIERDYPSETHFNHLLKAITILSDHVNIHYEEILIPQEDLNSENKDILSVLCKPKKIATLHNLSLDTLKTIYNELYLPENDDLNLPVYLNPDYFKNITPDKRNNSVMRIRAFYTNLIRYDHLQK